ncbi:MAG: hypothetical protein UX44_C0017G0019 [candidate division WWE3 bacterium GW2011_GWA1_46_21]|uniref:ATP synthase gamma chain n=3 Tax=Katanobacteria TaxID=422282 RepID=A0A0G1PD32_UNCKA|nr:MAG: hypothetical protein UX44_C0017G0019 [candidate division WWE3 bacterium GW2011_GWA1_46_21]KKU48837.1 MAG: hypothetical protein UX69_C0010G0005 [candidate division WWE3 bacterium GW2011_GWA2_46_9]KKU57299.1 MAG: hypothetical protein UX79_C0015G0007 [candidate division WWE3 bacterium GW2011_GWB1_47_11]
MFDIREVKNELLVLSELKTLVETYQEIAATRMRKIKSSVLLTREYLTGLNEVFQQIRYFYKKGRYKSVPRGNGKTVSVLLSANTMLYGDIIRKNFERFANDILSESCDAAIVGRVGYKMYKSAQQQLPAAAYFDFSDSGSDPTNLKKLINHVIKYDKIRVYHGQFKDILAQVPQKTLISEELISQADTIRQNELYIFEPSLSQIMAFFESQILASVFEQTVYESNLSKFASRMINLDVATEHINKKIYSVGMQSQLTKHKIAGTKQMTLLSGVLRSGGGVWA